METHMLYSWKTKEEEKQKGLQEEEQKQQFVQDNLFEQNQKQVIEIGAEEKNKDLTKDKRPEVFDNAPPTIEVFSKKQSLLRTGKYCFLSKKGEVLKGTRNTPSKKYMAPILDNLSRLDNYFAEKFDPAKEEEIQDCFKDTILSCENYIANRNPWTSEGKARLQMVKDFKEQLRTESVRFAEKVQGMIKEKDEASKDKTWLQVLTEVRTENVEDSKNGYKVTEGGAGSSKVYILEKDGKKQFFKQSEKLPSGRLYGTLDENIKELNKSKDEKDKRRAEYITTIKEAVMRHFKKEGYAFMQIAKNQKAILLFLLKELNYNPDVVEIINKMLSEVKEGEYDDSDFKYVEDALLQAKRNMTLHGIATQDAKIKDGSDISNRNVATSRMAKLLGIEDMVAKSTTMELNYKGKKMTGISMEEAKGESSMDIKKEAAFKNRKARYTPTAFRQLLNLQIFDIICGQVDRNAGNYLCQKVEKQDSNITEITELKAIDNDTCFGDLKYKDIFARGGRGLNRLRNIEDRNGINVPYMDKEFADKILALEPKQVDYVLCDILTKKERDAAIDRLKGVQKAIRKRINVENKLKAKTGNANSIFISNEKDKDNWGKAYADFSEKIKQMKQDDRDQKKILEKRLNDPNTFKNLSPEDAKFEKKNLQIMIGNMDLNTDDKLLQYSYLLGWHISD